MKNIVLFGAGKIGEAIVALLGGSGDYSVTVCDADLERAKFVASLAKETKAIQLDPQDLEATKIVLKDSQAVISALPYYCNTKVAQAAGLAGVHYFDLTEDVETTKAVQKIASDSKATFLPQCGIAPGFISIAANHVMQLFDELHAVKLRVGALPVYPSNHLKYNLTWSTEGLINEYGNPCEAVINGEKALVQPLEGYETFYLNGEQYECFNTSGGLGSMCDTYMGKVKNLDYKTIRYIGHRDLMVFLMNDLGFNSDRTTLKKVFERSIPSTPQDKCVIFVEVIGKRGGQLSQCTYASTVFNTVVGSKHLTAIQLTTAVGVITPLDMILNNEIKVKPGFMRVEDISLVAFLKNRFGSHYKDPQALSI